MKLNLSKINIQEFKYLQEVDSTNDEILRLAKLGDISEYGVCFAERQNKGRGRFLRQWSTFPYTSLAFSFFMEDFIEQTPLVLCVAIHKVLNQQYGAKIKIKWPNDIYSEEKKISGILIESYQLENRRIYIVGIGLNVFKCQEEQNIESKIGFLENATNQNLSRELILNDIYTKIKEEISLLKKSGFLSFKDYFTQNCLNINKEITIKIGNVEKKGIFSGVNDKGYLILNEKNTIVEIPAGEILQNK